MIATFVSPLYLYHLRARKSLMFHVAQGMWYTPLCSKRCAEVVLIKYIQSETQQKMKLQNSIYTLMLFTENYVHTEYLLK
jgi:hypothetical protein